MKVITYEKFKSRFPVLNNQINVDEMEKSQRGFYFTMYSLYSDYLERFLIKHTRIKNIDDTLDMNPLFNCVNDEDKDFYQELSTKLKFFYIRNNLHIENLSSDESKFLMNKIINDEYEFDTETEDFIRKTYKRVIAELPLQEQEAYINYGPEVEYFYAPSNALIIGLRYDEKDRNNLIDKKIILEDYISMLENDISNKLNLSVRVIIYDSSSIKKNETAKLKFT